MYVPGREMFKVKLLNQQLTRCVMVGIHFEMTQNIWNNFNLSLLSWAGKKFIW